MGFWSRLAGGPKEKPLSYRLTTLREQKEACSREDLLNAVNQLEKEPGGFLLLEPSRSVAGTQLLQAALGSEKGRYMVELSVSMDGYPLTPSQRQTGGVALSSPLSPGGTKLLRTELEGLEPLQAVLLDYWERQQVPDTSLWTVPEV